MLKDNKIRDLEEQVGRFLFILVSSALVFFSPCVQLYNTTGVY